MSNIRLDVDELTQAIDALLLQYPELADDDVLRGDMLEAETDLHRVLAILVDVANDASAMVEAIKLRASALAERKTRNERKEEAIRHLIQTLMERADLSKVVLPEATLSVSWRKPALIVVDEAALPDAFCKFIRKADLVKLKQLMADPDVTGLVPPGCVMSNGKNVLSIRTK